MATTTLHRRFVRRAKVLDRVADAPFVVVAAPGGWGKSTFCDQLVRAVGVATVRIGLKGPVGVDGLVAACRRASRRAGLSDVVEALASDDPDGALDDLVAALSVRADPVTLLVDDAQFLDTAGEDWVAELASNVTDRCRLIVSGRSAPGNLLGRYRSKVALVTADDLRFDADDVATILDLDAADGVVATILDASDGWPAAVGVAAARLAADPAWRPAPGRSLDLLDWLLLDLLRDDVETVARLSDLPLLDERAAELAAGRGALDRLREAGVPLRSVGAHWVAIADPIRELFLDRPAMDAAVTMAIAGHYAERNELATAVQWLLERGLVEELATIMATRHWTEWEGLGLAQVGALIERFGAALLARMPRLVLSACRVAETRDPDLHHAWLALGLEHGGAELLAEEAMRVVRTGDEAEALRLARRVLAEARADDLVARGRASMVVGLCEAFIGGAGADVRAQAAMDDAVSLLRLAGESRLEAEALLRYGYNVSYNGGRPQLAAEQLASCLALVPATSRDYATKLAYYADVLDTLGRSAEAEEAARRAMEIGHRLADPQAIGFGAWTLAEVLAHNGDLAGAHESMAIAEAHPGEWFASFHGVEYLGIMTDTLLRVSEDSGWEEYKARLLTRDRSFADADVADSIDAQEAVLFGDPFAAEQLLDRLEGSPFQPERTRWALTLQRALAKLRQGDEQAARALVADALAQAAAQGVPDLPMRHHRLVVRRLAAVWPATTAFGAPADAVTRVRLLGAFAIRRGLDEATPAEGNPATLAKLVALHRTMTADEAIELLWPDADADLGRGRLRNVLHRVRSRSGALVERRGETLVLADEVEVDVHRFETSAAAALGAEPDRRAGLARLALDAYGGDLLPGDVYEDWAAAPRERLRRRYLALLDVVAADALATGDLDEAVRVLDAAIAVEPLGEQRYVEAARALVVQGRRRAATVVVRRALAGLADLGVGPGKTLQELAVELDIPMPAA